MKAKIRKLVVTVEETLSEMGREISPPTRRTSSVLSCTSARKSESDPAPAMDRFRSGAPGIPIRFVSVPPARARAETSTTSCCVELVNPPASRRRVPGTSVRSIVMSTPPSPPSRANRPLSEASRASPRTSGANCIFGALTAPTDTETGNSGSLKPEKPGAFGLAASSSCGVLAGSRSTRMLSAASSFTSTLPRNNAARLKQKNCNDYK